jgi:hypothetical protein
MKRLVILALVLFSLPGWAQGVEWIDRQESYQAGLNQTVRIPIKLKNLTDRPQVFVVRKAQSDLGSNQKGYFCLGDDCSDPFQDQYSRKIESGETLANLYYVVETGLAVTSNSLRFEVSTKANPALTAEHSVSLAVEEKPAKSLVFNSKDITIHDVYPNPVSDWATIDYRIHNESLKAKVVIHNILGSPVSHHELPVFETKVKIQADELASGVYFYTVYLDNVGVLTRKLVVRK